MSHAHKLESFLIDYVAHGQKEFTQQTIVDEFAVTKRTASAMIQSYLRAVTDPNQAVSKVIYRKPGSRTVNSVWVIGDRTSDVKHIGDQAYDDLANRVMTTIMPTIQSMQSNNARTRKAAGLKLLKLEQALVEFCSTVS